MSDDEDEGGGGAWLISYADLMTLLFAAFVVLYGITPQGQTNEILGVVSSIRESFVEIPDDADPVDMQGPTFHGKFIFQEVRHSIAINPNIKKLNRAKTVLPKQDLDQEQVDILFNKLQQMGEGLSRSLRQATVVELDEIGVSLTMVGDVFFQPGSIELSASGMEQLEKIGKILQPITNDIHIEGHTDSYPSKGPYNNLEIAALRASSVRTLLTKTGIAPKRMMTSAYGPLQATSQGKTAAERANNRRVVIKIVFTRTGTD